MVGKWVKIVIVLEQQQCSWWYGWYVVHDGDDDGDDNGNNNNNNNNKDDDDRGHDNDLDMIAMSMTGKHISVKNWASTAAGQTWCYYLQSRASLAGGSSISFQNGRVLLQDAQSGQTPQFKAP